MTTLTQTHTQEEVQCKKGQQKTQGLNIQVSNEEMGNRSKTQLGFIRHNETREGKLDRLTQGMGLSK